MKRLFRIDESEKDRILGMHKSAISRQYLKEQEASSEQPATDGEASSEQPATDNAATEQVAFDCEKIDEVLETPDVKKWVEKITGPAKWTLRKDSHKLADRDIYKGVIDVIKIMQCKLSQVLDTELKPDGIFGNETNTKLKEFQTGKGLKADGIVGPATWGAMFVEEGTDGSQGDGNVPGDDSQGDGNTPGVEMKKCLDQFEDSNVNSKVKGGVPKLIQGIDYVFFDNGRFAIIQSSPEIKGSWKCDEGGKVMIKVTTPYKGPWVILIP
jgi:peptidoglycan hydrolase-like protein with peptidoglycan-binding domain